MDPVSEKPGSWGETGLAGERGWITTDGRSPRDRAASLETAFAAGQAAGLLQLAGLGDATPLPPDLAFFRGQARRLVAHFLSPDDATAYLAAESGKFQRLAELCEPIAARQEKLLVFTQFQAICQPLAAWLGEVFGRAGLVLHGGVPVGRRPGLVRRFQEDDAVPFFVISVKAGGTGLNLTAASHVVHFDRWWNPAVENQATDRAFRIGQKRHVIVHAFVCRGTLEERIDEMLRQKRDLAERLLGPAAAGEMLLTDMSDAELLEVVSLDVSRAAVE